jgi:hypothetical protein
LYGQRAESSGGILGRVERGDEWLLDAFNGSTSDDAVADQGK